MLVKTALKELLGFGVKEEPEPGEPQEPTDEPVEYNGPSPFSIYVDNLNRR